MAEPSTPASQLSIDDLNVGTEHLHGTQPADEQAARAAKARYYAELQSAGPVPLGCLPSHGIHIYRWDQAGGPCMCTTSNNSTEGEQ